MVESVLEFTMKRTGEGIPLVLVHAFPIDARMWDGVIEQIPPGRPVVTVDLPGMGASGSGPEIAAALSMESDPSLDVSAEAIARTLRANGIDRAIFAGLSMGGYVLLALLAKYPEMIAGLGLLNTKSQDDPEAAHATRLRVAGEVEEAGTVEGLVAMAGALVSETSRRTRPGVIAHTESLIRAQTATGVAWSQRAMAARPDRTEVLRAFTGPVTVLVGDEDETTPLPFAEHMASAAADVELVVVPSAGHLSALETPSEVARALDELQARVR